MGQVLPVHLLSLRSLHLTRPCSAFRPLEETALPSLGPRPCGTWPPTPGLLSSDPHLHCLGDTGKSRPWQAISMTSAPLTVPSEAERCHGPSWASGARAASWLVTPPAVSGQGLRVRASPPAAGQHGQAFLRLSSVLAASHPFVRGGDMEAQSRELTLLSSPCSPGSTPCDTVGDSAPHTDLLGPIPGVPARGRPGDTGLSQERQRQPPPIPCHVQGPPVHGGAGWAL